MRERRPCPTCHGAGSNDFPPPDVPWQIAREWTTLVCPDCTGDDGEPTGWAPCTSCGDPTEEGLVVGHNYICRTCELDWVRRNQEVRR
jgi:hypothetical protein